MRESGRGQRVAQLHNSYTMMLMMQLYKMMKYLFYNKNQFRKSANVQSVSHKKRSTRY